MLKLISKHLKIKNIGTDSVLENGLNNCIVWFNECMICILLLSSVVLLTFSLQL